MKKALISTQELVNRRDGKTECRVAQVESAENIFDVAEGLFWVDCGNDVVADGFTYDISTQAITAIPAPPNNGGGPIGNAPNVIA